MVKKYDSYFTDLNNMISDHLEENIKLIYPEVKQECPNCTLDTFAGMSKSSGKYKQGGPIPFEDGMPCPYCNGEGYKLIEKTENIPGRIYTSEKPYLKVKNVNIPEGSILFICKLQFFSKIMQAKYMIPICGIDNHTNELYQLNGQPEAVSFVLNPITYISSSWTKNR